MLVDMDLTTAREYLAEVAKMSGLSEPRPIVWVARGAYITPLSHFIDTTNPTFEWRDNLDEPSCYGVVDSPQQFFELFGDTLDANPKRMFVCFTPVAKEWEPEEGGWRWHKWGPYYGTQEPQCEYMYDEPDIELVYTYSLYTEEG